jgi:hypothetical protein
MFIVKGKKRKIYGNSLGGGKSLMSSKIQHKKILIFFEKNVDAIKKNHHLCAGRDKL